MAVAAALLRLTALFLELKKEIRVILENTALESPLEVVFVLGSFVIVGLGPLI